MRRVLVVHDEPAVARAVGRLLTKRGFAVRTCLSAREALLALEQETADAVVTDYNMPGMDGAALLREVKARWPEAVRVLISAMAATLSEALLAPLTPCALLAKPFRDDELVDALKGTGG